MADLKELSADEVREIRKFRLLNEKVGTVEQQGARRIGVVVKQNPEHFQSEMGKKYVRALSAILRRGECQCIVCDEKASYGDIFCAEHGAVDYERLEMQKRQVEIRNAEELEMVLEELSEDTGQRKTGRTDKMPDSDFVKASYQKFSDKINDMTGEKGSVKFKFHDLFSAIFQHHSPEEAEKIFIAGTSLTTPDVKDISREWPKPWLYSRVFLYILIAYAGLWVMVGQMGNLKGYPGLMFIGALSVPFSEMIFFWEINIPRNINLIEVIKIFLIGGVLSLIFTLTLDAWLGTGELDYTGAILTGLTEETAKAIALMIFLRKPKYQYILNGLLLGAAVGAGFAVFETAGYAFNIFIIASNINHSVGAFLTGARVDELAEVVNNLTTRSILAVGGHVSWTAFVGAGIMVVKKNRSLQQQHIFDPRFLKFLLICILLHGLWDCPLLLEFPEMFGFSSLHIILVVLIWIMLLIVIGAGLRQATRMANEAISGK